MNLCTCPAAAALTTIPSAGCPESFGQIQKIAFQRLRKADGTKNSFTSQNSILLKASWTALMAASDGTKIVLSPYVQAPTNEAGSPRTFGGGNETLGGVEIIIGREPTTFSAVIRSVQQSVIKAMKDLQCEAQADNLGVYLFDENGSIECIVSGTDALPIPIRALFIGDKVHGGLEAPDSNAISFSFLPNYSDDLSIEKPTDFNPLTDLVPASNS
jgi:hypothetical protein